MIRIEIIEDKFKEVTIYII